jgi:hypothetical protein
VFRRERRNTTADSGTEVAQCRFHHLIDGQLSFEYADVVDCRFDPTQRDYKRTAAAFI